MFRESVKIFTPRPLAEIYVPPADDRTWHRFRGTIGTFTDIVTN